MSRPEFTIGSEELLLLEQEINTSESTGTITCFTNNKFFIGLNIYLKLSHISLTLLLWTEREIIYPVFYYCNSFTIDNVRT